jgi:hypothetical protein
MDHRRAAVLPDLPALCGVIEEVEWHLVRMQRCLWMPRVEGLSNSGQLLEEVEAESPQIVS